MHVHTISACEVYYRYRYRYGYGYRYRYRYRFRYRCRHRYRYRYRYRGPHAPTATGRGLPSWWGATPSVGRGSPHRPDTYIYIYICIFFFTYIRCEHVFSTYDAYVRSFPHAVTSVVMLAQIAHGSSSSLIT